MFRVATCGIVRTSSISISILQKTMAFSSDDDLPHVNVKVLTQADVKSSGRERETPDSDEIIVLDDDTTSSCNSIAKRPKLGRAASKSPPKSYSSPEVIVLLDDSPSPGPSIGDARCARTSATAVVKKKVQRSAAGGKSPVDRATRQQSRYIDSDSIVPEESRSRKAREKKSKGKTTLAVGGKSSKGGPLTAETCIQKTRSNARNGLDHVAAILDQTLGENPKFMEAMVRIANSAGLQFCVADSNVAGSVRWVWSETGNPLDQVAKTAETRTEGDEGFLLVSVGALEYTRLIYHSKLAVSGSQLPSGCVSLEQHMSRMCEENPGARVTLAVHGMNAYRRGLKTRQNKEFRQKCLESGSSSPRGKESISGKRRRKGRGISSEEPSYDVSETDCQVALVQLQLSTGCVVKMCEGMADLASYVFSITKSLGASHFRKDSPVTFYCEDIRGPSKKDLYEASDKVCLIWKYMLNEFNDISMDMAAAVADVYPSPYLLLEAYRKCKDSKEGEQLLKDIVVRRGTGVLSSSRNLGPVQSKRIYTMMTSSDPNQLLD